MLCMKGRFDMRGLVLKLVETALFRFFVDVLLELTHLVADEAEDMVQGHPFQVGGVFGYVLAEAVEFGEERFGLHASS